MATVLEVAERAARDYLHPGDDQPVVVRFAEPADEQAQTWALSSTTLAPDELNAFAPGVVLETADGERALIEDVNFEPLVVTVVRGYGSTEAKAQAVGDVVTASPMFSRRGLIDAVKDEVVALYPSLWFNATAQITTGYDPIPVPREVVTPTRLLVQYGTSFSDVQFDYMDNFPPSETGKAIILRRPLDGYQAFFTYRSKFRRPASDDALLKDSGVEPEWERIVAVGAAAQVVAGRDTEQLSTEYVTQALEREFTPPEAPRGVRDGLLIMRSVWIEEAARVLRAEEPHPTIYNRLARQW